VTSIGKSWRSYLLEAFSGAPDGIPPWVEAMGSGDDEGYFGPDSAVWAVHGATPVIVAGIRALLVQTLHPGAMAGVHDWSRYRDDPLGRLAGTVRWVLTTSFADRAGADAASAYVRGLHARVVGEYAGTPYAAGDPELLRWVHDVFADSFLTSHLAWGRPIPGGADRYVSEWAKAGELMEVIDPPRSAAELRAQLAAFGPNLVSDERVREAVRFIRRPPLKRSLLPAYRMILGGAVATIPFEYRRMLGVRRPWWPAKTVTRIALAYLSVLLGRPSNAEVFARRRIAGLN
jgi:uncharacterized protein (DUF2236 family)